MLPAQITDIVTSLVSEVACGYFFLRSLDSQLEISRRTLTTRQESLPH